MGINLDIKIFTKLVLIANCHYSLQAICVYVCVYDKYIELL